MNEQEILEELLELLEASGVTIRREPLGGGGGGICTVNKKEIFFVDTQSPLAETIALCAGTVAKLVNVEEVYMKPKVREFVEKYRNNEKE